VGQFWVKINTVGQPPLAPQSHKAQRQIIQPDYEVDRLGPLVSTSRVLKLTQCHRQAHRNDEIATPPKGRMRAF